MKSGLSVGMLGKSRLAPARVLGRRRSKTRWARATGGQALVSRPVPAADRAARTGAHHLLHCSCPPLAGIYLLALVLAHLPACPRPLVPLHSYIPQSSVEVGLRWSKLVDTSASICKHLQVRCKLPCACALSCSQLARGALTERSCWVSSRCLLTVLAHGACITVLACVAMTADVGKPRRHQEAQPASRSAQGAGRGPLLPAHSAWPGARIRARGQSWPQV